MKASRKDYERLARSIKAALYLADKGYDARGIITTLAEDIIDTLEEANTTFQRERFLSACQLDANNLRGRELLS